jgi:DNA (cytosine-5)-methyltransferase 1
MPFTSIDLFAGIGGFRLAVEGCGGHTAAFAEIDPGAVRAYLDNHPGSAGTNLGDVRAIGRLP